MAVDDYRACKQEIFANRKYLQVCVLSPLLFDPIYEQHIRISRKEERVALGILALTFLEGLVRIVFFPNTCGKDVLILLIPTTIYNLRDGRVFVVALKLLI